MPPTTVVSTLSDMQRVPIRRGLLHPLPSSRLEIAVHCSKATLEQLRYGPIAPLPLHPLLRAKNCSAEAYLTLVKKKKKSTVSFRVQSPRQPSTHMWMHIIHYRTITKDVLYINKKRSDASPKNVAPCCALHSKHQNRSYFILSKKRRGRETPWIS
jgi:hypothetical protein